LIEGFRDPAGSLADQMRADTVKKLEQDGLPESWAIEETKKSPYQKFYQKMSYKFKPEDQAILTQIRAAVDLLIGDVFDDALTALDEFYVSVRVPTGRLDKNKRQEWEVDSKGRIKEDWDLLTGQDVEVALMELAKVRLITSQRVSEMFMDAVFAKHIWQDVWFEAYEGMIEGTQKDREARANRETREEKYAGHFRYTLWYRCDVFQKELVNLMRLLEQLRGWRIRSEANSKW